MPAVPTPYRPRHLRPLPRALRALGALGLTVLLVPTLTAAATGPDAGKVTICHATTSDGNPYVVNEPDKDGDVSGHADHTGPVWDPTLKKLKVQWGDIIPPFDYVEGGVTTTYPGLNWTADGQAVYRNGCVVPKPVLSLDVVKTNDADGNGTFSDSETAGAAGVAVPFRVTVTNTGPVDVVVTSLVDAVAGVPVPVSCTTALVGRVLAPAGGATCAFALDGYSPAAGTSKTNTATVVAAHVDDATNTATGSDTSVVATATAPPPPAAPLSLTVVKTNDADGDGTYRSSETASGPGVAVPFRAVVTNTGTTTVALTGLTDAVGGAPAAPVTCAPALPPTLAAGASATCAFTVPSPAAGTSVTDVVTATAADPADPTRTTSATGTSTVATPAAPVGAPDLAIVKTGPTAALTPGATASYALTVTNTGDVPGPVVVDDPVPTGTTLAGLTAPGFTCSGTGVHCVRDSDLAPGATATVQVQLLLSSTYSATTLVNTAVVGPADTTPDDNTSTVTTPVVLPAADLAVVKTGPAAVEAGALVTWVITVSNTGDAPALVVDLDDPLPAGVTVVGAPDATGWSCTVAAALSCGLDDPLAPGASATLSLTARLADDYADDTLVNTVTVGPDDATLEDNTSTVTTRVSQPFTGGGGGGVTVDPTTPTTPTGGGGGTALPLTGAPLDALVRAALWLLAAGAALTLGSVRRRTQD